MLSVVYPATYLGVAANALKGRDPRRMEQYELAVVACLVGFAIWSAVSGIGMWTGVKEGLDRAKGYLGTSLFVVAILVASQMHGDTRQASWAIEQVLSAAILFLPPLLYLMHSKRVTNTFGSPPAERSTPVQIAREPQRTSPRVVGDAGCLAAAPTVNVPSDDPELRVLHSQMLAGHLCVLASLGEARLSREWLVLEFHRLYSQPGHYPLDMVMTFLRGQGLIEDTGGTDGVGLSVRGSAFLAWCYATGRLQRTQRTSPDLAAPLPTKAAIKEVSVVPVRARQVRPEFEALHEALTRSHVEVLEKLLCGQAESKSFAALYKLARKRHEALSEHVRGTYPLESDGKWWTLFWDQKLIKHAEVTGFIALTERGYDYMRWRTANCKTGPAGPSGIPNRLGIDP